MRVIEMTMFYSASPNTFDKDIEKLGIKILRFFNDEVFTDLEKIIEEILKTIAVLEPPSWGRR